MLYALKTDLLMNLSQKRKKKKKFRAGYEFLKKKVNMYAQKIANCFI